jgi:hypothetical protein
MMFNIRSDIRSRNFSVLNSIATNISKNTMENEYVFNYDEVKRRFESVPSTNSITKKYKSMTYKTRFQPRTKSILGKDDNYPSMINKIQRHERSTSPKRTFQVHVIHVQQVMPIEQFSLQTQQGFYIMPTLIK